ncbi:MAG: hypothetical protein JO107_16980, partial [Hyphomicrobiales bacterium]|nr:hypothetical protein [Hyphomicrobiales bacterium]
MLACIGWVSPQKSEGAGGAFVRSLFSYSEDRYPLSTSFLIFTIALDSEKPNMVRMTVDWIRDALRETGKTRSGLAKALGRSPSAVTDLLNGSRR